jgi:tRNA A37 threonylcarbamoyladenosine modification protein TsaB
METRRRLILSIYSDTECGSIALGDEIAEQVWWNDPRSQSVEFLRLIERVLARMAHDFSDSDIDTIIAPRGPSSFTTVRSTLTIAKSLQLCFPLAKIFAPLHFQVLAFAAASDVLATHVGAAPQLFQEPQAPTPPELFQEPQAPTQPHEPQAPTPPELSNEPQAPTLPQLFQEPQAPTSPQSCIAPNIDFYVLLNALNSGVFVAPFRCMPPQGGSLDVPVAACFPVLAGPPFFCDAKMKQKFFEKNNDRIFVTNFSQPDCITATEKNKIIHVTKNLASEQIELYLASGERAGKDDLSPFYLHSPEFRQNIAITNTN